ncbi:hypothetical protein M1L60_35940 [Actinoplanes sp. TRM 88003]|uniref:Uncharacterized protein n=1 Tax=Paractinoplanes aksuensis TaxID=2939490 RepID=A0ABT1DYM6_9ACTN|nr:hypothetical protein [Actinoplanes aksuensis]MCO8275984.1 hypothetical protein [Actinoplanes aksuensis]
MTYEQRPRPTTVEAGASLVGLVGLVSAGRVAYGVILNLSQDHWSAGARGVFLVLNSIVLIFALFLLVLAYQVRRGRTWAWIVSLVMLPFTILFGGLLTLITAGGGAFPFAGAAVVTSALAALLTLTIPRSARAYFLAKPPPPIPPYPYPAPRQPWDPNRTHA